jgi:hypothetical protein
LRPAFSGQFSFLPCISPLIPRGPSSKDLSGKTLRREICEFNDLEDHRLCMEWDTGAKRRDAKTATGDWIKISDE